MYLTDYHIHTKYSPDSKISIDKRCKWAIENKIDEICITDHIENWSNGKDEYLVPDYKNLIIDVEKAREKYKNKLKIKIGGELGIYYSLLKEANNIILSKDLDYVLGSYHQVRDLRLHPKGELFVKNDRITAYNIYFEHVLDTLKNFDNFDCHGHLDVIARYNLYENKDFKYIEHKELVDEILKLTVEKGKGLEINVGSVHYKLKQFHPTIEVLKAFKNLGGEIVTIGSDSHALDNVNKDLILAQEMLKNAGFHYLSTYDKRKPNFIKL